MDSPPSLTCLNFSFSNLFYCPQSIAVDCPPIRFYSNPTFCLLSVLPGEKVLTKARAGLAKKTIQLTRKQGIMQRRLQEEAGKAMKKYE